MADDTLVFRFLVNGHPPPFLPGQACDVTLPDGQTQRCAIASSPTNGRTLMFAARIRGSPFGQTLRDLPFGAAVRIGPATGDFTLPKDPATTLVLVAGGLGIVPFRSILKWMADTGERRPVTLLYAGRAAGSMAFLDELEAWRASIGLDLAPTITATDAADASWPHERGCIDAGFVQRHVRTDALARATVYVSGPRGFVQDVAGVMRSLGVPANRLKLDTPRGP